MSKIANIVKEVSSLSVIEVAELVKALEEELGVSAAMPVAAAAPAAAGQAAAPAEEKTDFTVTLKDAGSQKIKVIKALRTVTTLGLKEAKEVVEAAPSVIAESVAKEDAEKMKKELEEAGAVVELS